MPALLSSRFVPWQSFRDLPLRAVATLLRWHERSRQRAMLARLDEHLLRDIGLSRAEVEEELRKPFWRA
ncbi:MAG: DUF1127 domain-containing protein [Rhodospirillales bacterium]|nr:DUF1127 domain-containing protein [Rhodospirillales bacterium]